MKAKSLIGNCLIFLIGCLLAAQVGAEGLLFPRTQREKVSYGLGVGLARHVKAQKIETAPDLMIKGLRDELSGKRTATSDIELQRVITQFTDMSKSIMNRGIELNLDLMILGFEDELLHKKLRLPKQEINRTLIMLQVELKRERNKDLRNTMEENLRKGDSFLAENKNKEGVVSLPSGLQYKVLKAGDGRMATDGDTVECHYRGTHLSGMEFESSYRKGQPETFKISRVILGWKEALKLIPVGSKLQLFIPPHLAYGVGGRGNDIGPNETLIYELEVLSVR